MFEPERIIRIQRQDLNSAEIAVVDRSLPTHRIGVVETAIHPNGVAAGDRHRGLSERDLRRQVAARVARDCNFAKF